MDKDTEIVQQHVKVKKAARLSNLVLEIPEVVIGKYRIKAKDDAAVSTKKVNGNVLLIYEFKKKV